jgi:hypothetical protein
VNFSRVKGSPVRVRPSRLAAQPRWRGLISPNHRPTTIPLTCPEPGRQALRPPSSIRVPKTEPTRSPRQARSCRP